ncbi:hypothetical protein PO878_19140 [Iamia majanohamensis]|uniref:Uncharacterized protein n=1 Tax=Iamia majanohamensis TaxID=467976 RepID=A0AAE9Y6R2_9ACTN|nr:hypothetical protein [Iamia majanohamensis]WCO66616.1 hypothetical protein PO878_19140 [Iamia majanohamensis]
MSDRRPPRHGWRTLPGLLLPGLVALVVLVVLSTTVWPGQATVTRHVLCDDARPDAFVLYEEYDTGATIESPRGSTSIRFTMQCVSADGRTEDVGWLRPVALVAALYAVLAIPVVVVARLVLRRRRDRPGPDGPPISGGPVS